MPFSDTDLHPHATALALETAKKHQEPTDDGVVFYSGWFCPFVDRVWLALEEKGIPYQYKEENPYFKDEEFLKISPKGLVPAILTPGPDRVPIHESLVILEYLEDAYPSTKPLLPPSSIARAEVRLAIDHVTKNIVPGFFKLLQAQDADSQGAARTALEQALLTFASLIKGPYLAGEQLTIGDLVLAPFVFRFFILEKHREFSIHKTDARLRAWIEAIERLPSYQNTRSEKDLYEQFYKRYLDDVTESLAAKAVRSGGIIP